MNLSKYRLHKELLIIFDHLTDEQKIETAIQEYSIDDILRIFTYYELEQHTYAKNVFLEKYRNNPYALFYYSKDIVCGRWPEAEPTIMTSPEYAYHYAFHVIKGRWPEAEPMIMADPVCACQYALNIIKGRWPQAEPTIIKKANATCIYLYSYCIIEERWPEAEPTMKYTNYWPTYKNHFKL